MWKKIITNRVDFLSNLEILPEYPRITVSNAMIKEPLIVTPDKRSLCALVKNVVHNLNLNVNKYNKTRRDWRV